MCAYGHIIRCSCRIFPLSVRRRAMITASATPVPRVPTTPAPPRLLDVLQQAAAERRHSVETLRASGDWTTPFILCRGNQQPRDLTNAEVGRFLGHRARTDTER